MAAESVPTSVHSGKTEAEPYRFYAYMTMPALMKASVPDGKLICLNGVKDSTEEWSVLTHFPSHAEREVYVLSNYYLHSANGLRRAMDGFLVCLGDGSSAEEWTTQEVITVLGPIAPDALGITQTHEHMILDAYDH